jgi:hypothetical protein
MKKYKITYKNKQRLKYLQGNILCMKTFVILIDEINKKIKYANVFCKKHSTFHRKLIKHYKKNKQFSTLTFYKWE